MRLIAFWLAKNKKVGGEKLHSVKFLSFQQYVYVDIRQEKFFEGCMVELKDVQHLENLGI